jgi:2-polyprenyl-6-methoxyphenol hydroxylase-like FAD-dependent oxidoreductase
MCDVTIVGGGPVGMLLAAELGLQGVRPLVLERLAMPSGASKAGTLHARTAQSLDRRGLDRAAVECFRSQLELYVGPVEGANPADPTDALGRTPGDF